MRDSSSANSNSAGAVTGGVRRQRGATMVEFAFVLILLMTLLLGVVGFAHALYAYHFVNNAAKTASRWAAVNGSTCNDDSSCNGAGGMNNGPASQSDIQNYVLALVPQGIDSTQVNVTAVGATVSNAPAVCATTWNAPGCTIQVTVTYNFSFIFPLVPTAAIPMSSTSEMVVAH